MNHVVIQSDPYPSCSTSVQVSGVTGAEDTVILVIRTGAASLQTYATRAELRLLGELLLRHANENETLQVTA
jgi:hypothetical protein